MSRVFSITIMVSAMRMLSAATITMRVMTMKVTMLFECQGAEEFVILVFPVGGHESRGRRLARFAVRSAGALLRLSTLKLMTETRSGSS